MWLLYLTKELQKNGQLTLENDFLEGALTKVGLLSAKRLQARVAARNGQDNSDIDNGGKIEYPSHQYLYHDDCNKLQVRQFKLIHSFGDQPLGRYAL